MPGATGRFPEGKIHPNDEGELVCEVRINDGDGLVGVFFGKSVSWIACTPEQADVLAAELKSAARMLRESAT
jgi:hypothetical protein